MIIKNRIEPQPGQVFQSDCFDVNVGEEINLMISGDDHVGVGKIISVEVAGDGSHAWLVVDVPGLASDTIDIGPVHLAAQEGPGFDGYAEEGIS